MNHFSRRIAEIVRRSIESGSGVEIDGLGTFLPGRKGGFRFLAQIKPRVFIAYVEEDLDVIKNLYRAFELRGFRPWLDKKNLMPGQNWPRAIERAIEASDYFVACFSKRSTSKRGAFHSELRYALACAAKVPLDEIFFIPVRLDDCIVPGGIAGKLQYINLFPNRQAGVQKLVKVIRGQELQRQKKKLPLAS